MASLLKFPLDQNFSRLLPASKSAMMYNNK